MEEVNLDEKIRQLDEKKTLLEEEKKRLEEENIKQKIVEKKLQEERELISANIRLREEVQKRQEAIMQYEARNKELEDSYTRGETPPLFLLETQLDIGDWLQGDQLQHGFGEFFVEEEKYRKVVSQNSP